MVLGLADLHDMLGPLPQLVVGLLNLIALNLDFERLIPIPHGEQGTPAHLGPCPKAKLKEGVYLFVMGNLSVNFLWLVLLCLMRQVDKVKLKMRQWLSAQCICQLRLGDARKPDAPLNLEVKVCVDLFVMGNLSLDFSWLVWLVYQMRQVHKVKLDMRQWLSAQCIC